MQNQNYPFNDNNFGIHDKNSSNQIEPDSYEYVFSSGSGYDSSDKKAKKKKNKRSASNALVVVLCIVLSFGAGFGGAFAALQFKGSNVKQETQTIFGAPDPNELLKEDPESILDKGNSTTTPYGSAGEDVFTVSQVSAKVLDTVVVIEASVTSSSIFGESGKSTSTGSGVIISADGYILTCNHVVKNAVAVKVTLNSGDQYAASMVGSDASSDLAVLKIAPNAELPYAKQGCSSDLVLGEQVIAIGNPLGTLYRTVTSGVISGLERNILTSDGTTMTLLQTDAAVNSGNSGGGLFNLDGDLIGIVNAKYAEEGVEGLAFAIPIDWAYEVQLDLIEYGYVRGIIDHGISAVDVTASNLNRYYYYYGIDTVGVYVVESKFTAELQNKDRIVSVNGVPVSTVSQIEKVLENSQVGDKITIVADRSGQSFTVNLTLREYVPENQIK